MYDKDDYLVEVLQGKHTFHLPEGDGFKKCTSTYKQVCDRKEMVRKLKETIDGKFFAKH